jgi:DNA-directed RNA polymerase subunit beta
MEGYNFEDAIVISEKVVRDDIFTSIHVDDYSLEVRDTKLGNEELTNDIPNVSEEAKDLDENGMIRIGAEVKPGDILMEKLLQRGIRSTQKRNCFVQSSVIKQVM